MLNYPRLTPAFIIGFIILLAIGLGNLDGSSAKITDPFHQGEYFASFASMFNHQASQNYLTIHGALDYIPAWLSFKIYGPTHYFFGTIFLYALTDILSAILFYILVTIFTDRFTSNYQAIVLIVAAIVSPMLVTYRDLLLLASLLLYFACQMELRPLARSFVEIGLGVTVALNIFWSFDRGIAGLVSIGLACLIMTYRNKSYVKSLISFFLSILILNYCTEKFSLHNYIENIKFLINTSSQWSYGLQMLPVIRSVTLLLLCSFGLFVLFKSVNNKITLSNESIANGVLLVMLMIFFFKIGTNRADLLHIHWSMWPVIIAFLYGQHNKESLIFSARNDFYCSKKLFDLIRHSGLENLSFILILIALMTPANLADSYHLLSSIIRPRANEELVSDGVKWIANELKRTGTNCVFDLANHGVINGFTALPSCTRFAYPVYANKNYENEIIESLVRKKPSVIIYSSTHWSFSIDNKNMHDRFPNVKNYLDKEYSNETCKFDYCLRYLASN